MKKYAVYPSYVISRNDGDRHFIGFLELCRLYGVNPAECVNMQNWTDPRGTSAERLIQLTVRYDGNYTIPTSTPRRDRAAKRSL